MPESETHRPDARLAYEAELMRRNAAARRRAHSAYGGLQKLLVMLVLVVSLSGATLLLLSAQSRQLLLTRLGQEWTRLYESDETKGIFELPPPPPRRVEPQVVLGSSPSAPIVDQPSGEVYTSGVDETGRESLEKKFIPPQVTPGFEAAFKLLTADSPAASKLFSGQLPGYQYKEWKPLQNKHPEYYVSLVAERTSDQIEVQFVWSVNTETSRITPLSQAARDLEREN